MCSVESCDRPTHNKTTGYCAPHYKRYWRTGDAQAHVPIAEKRRAPLKVEDHPDGTRTCAGCGERKPLDAYHRDSRAKGGRRPTCKACRVAIETARYHADPEAHRERMRRFRAQNPEHVRDRDAARYERHRAARIEAALAQTHIRRARIAANGYEKGITVRALRKRDGDTCYWCGTRMSFTRGHERGSRPRNQATIEHIIPIARGGGHTWGNCTLACWACNISKGARDYPSRLLLGALA